MIICSIISKEIKTPNKKFAIKSDNISLMYWQECKDLENIWYIILVPILCFGDLASASQRSMVEQVLKAKVLVK